MKIFGREPALIIAFIGAVLTALAAFSFPGVSAGAAAAITALVSGLLIAVTTRPVAPGLFAGLVPAAAAVLAEYKFHASSEQIAVLSGLVLAGFALLGRGQITPAKDQAPTTPEKGPVR